jgi:hypothetical protein
VAGLSSNTLDPDSPDTAPAGAQPVAARSRRRARRRSATRRATPRRSACASPRS